MLPFAIGATIGFLLFTHWLAFQRGVEYGEAEMLHMQRHVAKSLVDGEFKHLINRALDEMTPEPETS